MCKLTASAQLIHASMTLSSLMFMMSSYISISSCVSSSVNTSLLRYVVDEDGGCGRAEAAFGIGGLTIALDFEDAIGLFGRDGTVRETVLLFEGRACGPSSAVPSSSSSSSSLGS